MEIDKRKELTLIFGYQSVTKKTATFFEFFFYLKWAIVSRFTTGWRNVRKEVYSYLAYAGWFS